MEVKEGCLLYLIESSGFSALFAVVAVVVMFKFRPFRSVCVPPTETPPVSKGSIFNLNNHETSKPASTQMEWGEAHTLAAASWYQEGGYWYVQCRAMSQVVVTDCFADAGRNGDEG